LPKEHAYAPVKYDVEELSQKDAKVFKKMANEISKDKGADAGDCDTDDEECRKESVSMIKKTSPTEESKVQISSKLRILDDKKEKKVEEAVK